MCIAYIRHLIRYQNASSDPIITELLPENNKSSVEFHFLRLYPVYIIRKTRISLFKLSLSLHKSKTP